MTFEEFVAKNHPNAPKADVNNMRLGWDAGVAASMHVPEPTRDPNARTRASDVETAVEPSSTDGSGERAESDPADIEQFVPGGDDLSESNPDSTETPVDG